MATAALTSAAIGTVTGSGLPLAGRAAGQLVAGARAGHGPDPRGYRPQATRGEDGQRIATPARAQEVLIPGPAGGSGGSRTVGGSGE